MVELSRRRFNFEEDYDIVGAWWKAHGSRIPSPEYLSKTGLIIDVNKNPVAAGFLYRTDSAFCLFKWFAVNPDASKEHRDKALNYLIKSAVEWCQEAGFKAIYTSTNVQKMIRRLEDAEFVQADKGITHMFYGVENG